MRIDCLELREALGESILKEMPKINRKLTCAIVQIGDRPDSNKYIKNKLTTLDKYGAKGELHKYPEDMSVQGILDLIKVLNASDRIDGIIVQLPLPLNMRKYTDEILEKIHPSKDLDCITPQNEAKVYGGDYSLYPCTVQAVFNILDSLNFDINGEQVVVLGRSKIVGLPLATALINKGATVVSCNSKTKKENLEGLLKNAKVIISATGQINPVNPELITKNHILIDVGINFNEEGKLCGDFDVTCQSNSLAYTPVPSGVGILTTVNVVGNLLKLYNRKKEIQL
ncbi:MAG: tetrahydrofolate dehydrogenase/cyclohydrolase catalytic domain-containing protein [Fusobacteriaceae bacterium]